MNVAFYGRRNVTENLKDAHGIQFQQVLASRLLLAVLLLVLLLLLLCCYYYNLFPSFFPVPDQHISDSADFPPTPGYRANRDVGRVM